jgi:hypothetical protein
LNAGNAALNCRIAGWHDANYFPPHGPATNSNLTDNRQQDQGADGGIDDYRRNTNTQLAARPGMKPASYERVKDSNNEISDNPISGARDNFASPPSGYKADQYYDHQTLIRQTLIRRVDLTIFE